MFFHRYQYKEVIKQTIRVLRIKSVPSPSKRKKTTVTTFILPNLAQCWKDNIHYVKQGETTSKSVLIMFMFVLFP